MVISFFHAYSSSHVLFLFLALFWLLSGIVTSFSHACSSSHALFPCSYTVDCVLVKCSHSHMCWSLHIFNSFLFISIMIVFSTMVLITWVLIPTCINSFPSFRTAFCFCGDLIFRHANLNMPLCLAIMVMTVYQFRITNIISVSLCICFDLTFICANSCIS